MSKYYGAFKRWKTFITAEGGQAIPAEPVHVALYITHLIDTGSSAGTVQAAVYGIKWAHTVRGIVDPTSNHYVKSLLESAKRQNSKPVQKKDIVSKEQIILLCEKYSSAQDVSVLRDLSIILLCFAGFMRFNEVSAIKCKDVTFHDNHMSIHIAKSKTDQYREGNNVLINGGVTAACLVTMLKRYIGNAKIEPTSGHFLPMYTVTRGKYPNHQE